MKKFIVSIKESNDYHVPVFAIDETEAILTAQDAFANCEDDEEMHSWLKKKSDIVKVVT